MNTRVYDVNGFTATVHTLHIKEEKAFVKKNLRNEMPNVSAFIDKMREAFGKDMIDEQIRKGLRGEPCFYAKENGHEVGTKSPRGTRVTWDSKGVAITAEDDDDRLG